MDIFFTTDKLRARIDELSLYRMRGILPMLSMESCPCPSEPVNPALPGEDAAWETVCLGDEWAGRDTYLWLRCRVRIPEKEKNGRPVGVFDFGKTGSCNCSGFESLLYVDGVPYQGVDTHHNEVYFPETWAGEEKTLLFRIWAGLEGGGEPQVQHHRFSEAYSAILDAGTDELYYTGKMLLESLSLLDKNDALYERLLQLLNRAVNLVDRREKGNEAFYASVRDAAEYLRKGLAACGGKLPVRVTALGNTHIDLAWLWRYKHTREKAARSFSTVLRLMELYPEYTFLMSQPQTYEWIKQDFPELYEQIRERIKEGRWEIDGGMWVEADCNIPSGESLTRQFLVGSEFARWEFGKEMHCLWLPDVFGYSWALPQILKKSGIDIFVTTKISWNECNQMPYDTFTWTGIDGSQVLAHFITTPAAAEEQGSWYYTYNGEMLPSSVKGIWNNYKNKGLTSELLLAYGYGDGGGGVNREELQQRRVLDVIPGLPEVKTGHAKEYFDRLRECVKNTEDFFPEWDGELYLENHRGTYTSHAYNKLMNRRMEHLYRDAEWISVLAGLSGENAPQARDRLLAGWKIILRNQFHDVIPGSAIAEVYEDSRREYAEAEKIANAVIEDSFAALSENGEGISLVNSGIWDYEGLVELPLAEGETLSRNGTPLPVQHGKDKARVFCRLPAMSIESFTIVKFMPDTETPFAFNGEHLETPYYSVTFDACGRITALWDKKNSRSVLPEGRKANRMIFFEDQPVVCDAWNINLYYTEKPYEVDRLTQMSVLENGPLAFVLRCEWKYGKSHIGQNILFYAHSPQIDFQTDVDMHETHQLLKVEFPVRVRSTFATFDIQYGNVRRPNHWNTSWDIARFETVMHKWVDLSDSNYGVSVLNDSKYGCDVKGDTIRLTLIKTATYPDHLQDQGEHRFTYSLLPHTGDVLHSSTEQAAFFLNDPIRMQQGRIDRESFLSLDTSSVSLDAVKTAEDGESVVVRLHEYCGAEVKCRLKTGYPFSAFTESDLMERPQGPWQSAGAEIPLCFTPYEVKTILLKK